MAKSCYTTVQHEGRWRLALVTEDEAGYFPQGQPFDASWKAAGAAEWLNKQAGTKRGEVARILKSAMDAQEARDAEECAT